MLAETISALVKPVIDVERVSLLAANGRLSAEPVMAALPLPSFTHAVMDGYALGSSPPGQYIIQPTSLASLGSSDAIRIAAGEPVPTGTAAVVLSDRAEISGTALFVARPLRKDNLRRMGEEATLGDVIIPANTKLDARHSALATAAGIDTVTVKKRPRVALLGIRGISTNLPHLSVMTALLHSPRLSLTQAGTVQTTLLPELLQQLAPNHDLIIVVAESLGGEQGVLDHAVTAIGGTAAIHRAALKPAKPVVTGKVGGATVIGLAGTAYASTIAAHLFVRPALARLLGMAPSMASQPAIASFSRKREPGRAEALPVLAQRQGLDQHLALALAGRFGQLKALAAMDGFAIIDADEGDIMPGTRLSYMPLLMPLV
jgi:molybdopterin molybdotransferase